ncbi:MAG: M56 family metallopeptidase, partial [Planctomycetaceae bacterium]
MISFGLAYLWCIIQVTVLTGAVLAVCLCIGRRHPVFRSFIVSTGLGLVLGLSVLLLSPWPKWSVVSSERAQLSAEPNPVEIGDLLFAQRKRQFDGDQHPAPAPLAEFPLAMAPIAAEGAETTEATASDERNTQGRQFASSRQLLRVVSKSLEKLNRPDGGLQAWLRYLTIVSLLGIAIGAIRLLHGWLSVRNFRAEARLVSDQRLSDALDIAQASLGCVRHIELRESAKLSSPATVGWLRPIIMLPSDWPEWSEDECLGVIAHEVAHVRRGDFFTWFLAQCALVLHFYHPFVHWLVSGLRLEQELAADAAAAGVVGSHRSYLRMLATMASREADRPPHRMLRTFLPTQGTLVARLEMLRSQRLVAGPGSSSKRVFVVALLLSFGMVAAGLRGEITVGGDGELKLDYVPDAALLAVAVRPGRLVNDRLLSEFGIAPQQAQFCGAPLTSLEQVTLFILAQGAERQGAIPEFSGLVVQTRTSAEARALLCRAAGKNSLDDETAKGLVEPTDSGAFFGSQPEAKTVVLTLRQGDLEHALAAGLRSNRSAAWLNDWNECGGSDLRVYAAVQRLRPMLERLPARPPEFDQVYAEIESAWRSADSVTMG